MKKHSESPLINKEYLIPKKLCHKKGIDRFLASYAHKQIIVFQVLEFLRSVISIVCSNSTKKIYGHWN